MQRSHESLDFPLAPTIDEGASLPTLLKKNRLHRDEYKILRDALGRSPTLAELGVTSAMWSEHCSYKSSKIHLKRLPTTGPQVVVGPGENAGVVRLHGKTCIAFKMESHNHPSYIEPYQGAATGVGGILRDVFCMGARPIANLNCLRFGSPDHPRTRYLYERVVKGVGDYGNCVGIPTVGGSVVFDSTYNGNCRVNAMTAGLIDEDKIFKGFASGVGNLVVYLGSSTGRDGIHGATMASDSFSDANSGERSTVQVGDPFMEKLLLEATLEALEKGLVVGLLDMGAAGLTSSSFEMAARAGTGIHMDLDKIPVRASKMTAYELLLSESQERMLMVIKPEKWPELAAVLEKWLLAYAVVGEVTNSGRVICTYQGKREVDMAVDLLTDNAPLYDRPRTRVELSGKTEDVISAKLGAKKPAEHLAAMLRNSGSKEFVFRQYDQHIGRKSVRDSDDHGAAVMWIRDLPSQPHIGVGLSAGCNSLQVAADSYWGTAETVARCARMLNAVGAEPLAITDCMNFGNPEDPKIMAQFSDSIDGMGEACRKLGVAVVSGNVSLYNETNGSSIYPTPMIGMVGRVTDIRSCPRAYFPETGDVYLLRPNDASPHLRGSLVAKSLGFEPWDGAPVTIAWDAENEAGQFLRQAAREGMIAACRDVGQGGVATTLAKMALPKNLGITRKSDNSAWDQSAWQFGEWCGAYLVMFAPGKQPNAALKHCRLEKIAEVTSQDDFAFLSPGIALARLRESFEAFGPKEGV